MKHFFTLLILSLMALQVQANHDNAMLAFQNEDHKRIAVMLNGRLYKENSPQLTIQDIQAGAYEMNVFEYAYNTHIHGYKRKLIFSNWIYIAPMKRYEFIITITNKVLMTDVVALYNEHCDDEEWQEEEVWIHQPYTVFTEHIPVCVTMNTQDFDVLINNLKKSYFDDDRTAIFQSTLRFNNFETDQVAEVMRCFTFEDTKLNAAKAAFNKTCDKQRYFTLMDDFTFSSTAQELATFIQSN